MSASFRVRRIRARPACESAQCAATPPVAVWLHVAPTHGAAVATTGTCGSSEGRGSCEEWYSRKASCDTRRSPERLTSLCVLALRSSCTPAAGLTNCGDTRTFACLQYNSRRLPLLLDLDNTLVLASP